MNEGRLVALGDAVGLDQRSPQGGRARMGHHVARKEGDQMPAQKWQAEDAVRLRCRKGGVAVLAVVRGDVMNTRCGTHGDAIWRHYGAERRRVQYRGKQLQDQCDKNHPGRTAWMWRSPST